MKKEFKDRQDERFTLHKKEFNLSEKINHFPDEKISYAQFLEVKDVKEFIKKLKEVIPDEWHEWIDILAGDL